MKCNVCRPGKGKAGSHYSGKQTSNSCPHWAHISRRRAYGVFVIYENHIIDHNIAMGNPCKKIWANKAAIVC
jgi:hypothetical protein